VTKKDFFNNALTLFKWAIEERRAGRQIASLDGELYRELRMPALDSVEAAVVVKPPLEKEATATTR
jgi:hypothetical protein